MPKLRHEIVNDEFILSFKFRVLGRKGFMEIDIPMRMLENPEVLFKWIDDKIDEYVVQNAMENMPPEGHA